ncbi:MAG: hypothetical protein LBF08_06025 [Dysgonamonadaceae bacterium]|jgi:hypothetical protein|nr:hypothetical protein [Dysgonamonadaceae bacterium]
MINRSGGLPSLFQIVSLCFPCPNEGFGGCGTLSGLLKVSRRGARRFQDFLKVSRRGAKRFQDS